VKNRQLALTLGSLITGIVILLSSCKKINEPAEVGGDVIPVIDNITTFDTTISVEAYNGLFTIGGTDPLLEDSTYSNYTAEQFLGVISNDPIFGKTDAQMYFELKPPQYPFTFVNKYDSLHLDSVVLILDYVEAYGDTLTPQSINVYEIAQSSDFRVDTAYLVRLNNNINLSTMIGTASVVPQSLKDSVRAYKDTTSHQLRIRLDNSFGDRLLKYDTVDGPNDAYSNDSLFRTKFKGFALKSVSGNGLMGFDLAGKNTKLAIYYRDDNNGAVKEDTVVDYFVFRPFNTYFTTGSAAQNYVKRDYSGYPIQAAQGGTTQDNLVYLQNTPGSFATIKIPFLGSLNNRVVHRAELIAEQVWDVSDSSFRAPDYLYLDAYSPSTSKYRNIPFDVVYDVNGFNLGNFGVAPIFALDGSNNLVRTWHFNLTRYVQHVVNDTEPVYDLRLFAPYYTLDEYVPPVVGGTPITGAPTVFINPTIAKGRVRLAGGNAPGSQRMRMRIIYSKL
jgi:hypothetical protein